jgi:hypothetical protein
MMRIAAMAGADVAALPLEVQEPWELSLGLPERSAENRICLAAASRRGGLLATLEEDFTLMTPWPTRTFDGNLTRPIVTRTDAGRLCQATLHPARAANKSVSHRTHLIDGRPWQLVGAITKERSHA